LKTELSLRVETLEDLYCSKGKDNI